GGEPVTVVARGASAPRWAPDGKSLYYVAPADGVAQLWRLDFAAGKSGLDIQDYKLSPDGKSVLLSYALFTDCGTLACTKQMQDKRAADKATGTLYKKLFVRHWDTWSDGTRNQLYLGRFDAHGQLPAEPMLLTSGIDGDVPSKPFGDESEFAYSPDGKTVYFD